MKLLILSILLLSFHWPGFMELSPTTKLEIHAETGPIQTDTIEAERDTTGFAEGTKVKLKESSLYKKASTLGKFKILYFLSFLIGCILLLRFSSHLLQKTDKLLLRIQHRPNLFDGYRFTGNPFILKSPFYALYHLFLGKSSYQSYLVWPLKYSIIISFLASIVIRCSPDEAFITAKSFLEFFMGSLSAQISFSILILMILTTLVLLCIESIKKTKWLFPLRLLIFLLLGGLIFILMYLLFWFTVGITILYLFTYWGKSHISLQRTYASSAYSTEDFIYEPWPDSSKKIYPNT